MTDIIRQLTAPGTFVIVPSGKPGMVRSFNATSNECTVQYGATGFIDALYGAFNNDTKLRDQGLMADFHFSKLRLAPKTVVDQLTGQTP